ncbi:hypothetical protein [Flavobacterium sp. NKUCC04_CG]|uniref:hypothetical protein n=1 Tax=Flavobacterium sp. NKUCC04_CG TaxID=2842121 RepID=UPI001C5B5F94|nr:hypothetical protein [Flavobacterium sp. NKUCC04_CG]MBW3519227.1 hypothetical protein [Flavobacterium sp. NKUCC04_CG]
METTVKEMLHDIIENPVFDEKVIDCYFAYNYIQIVDHTHLNLKQFKSHIQKLKSLIARVEVEVLNCASNDKSVFTKHLVRSILKDGSKHTHKVFAEFVIKDGKIVKCEELTFLIEGSEAGKDLGSVVM